MAFLLLRNSTFNASSEIGPEVTLRLLVTSCAKDYKGHSLVQTSFTEPPNINGINLVEENVLRQWQWFKIPAYILLVFFTPN